jgi:hypothetical protein
MLRICHSYVLQPMAAYTCLYQNSTTYIYDSDYVDMDSNNAVITYMHLCSHF